jgi:hypothetical protein
LTKDLFHIIYDSEKLTPNDMLETVKKQGLEGVIITGAARADAIAAP